MNPELKSSLIDVLAAGCNVDADQINESTELASLKAGSIQLIAVCSTAEDELDIDLPLRDVLKCVTVGELFEAIESHVE